MTHKNKIFVLVSIALFLIATCVSMHALMTNLGGPILDSYGFRQTQTALSAYYLAEGGPILAYETPVVGEPWAIPFEFPTMQLIAAGLHTLGVPLDVSGRLVSYFFLFACLVPIFMLFRSMQVPSAAYWATAAIFVSAPLHLFWARSFLIETTALFFSLFWLACFVTLLKLGRHKVIFLILTLLFGVAAALTKSTTFIPALIFGFCFFVQLAIVPLRAREYMAVARISLTAAAAAIIPLAIGQAWVLWTDNVKSLNVIGNLLTSTALSAWNFGTIQQRLSIEFWTAFESRMLTDIFGAVPYLAAGMVGLSLIYRRSRSVAVFCLLAFFGSLMVVSNLHFVHSYYQVAIAVFLLIPAGVAVTIVAERKPIVGSVIICLVCISQISLFYWKMYPVIAADHSTNVEYRTALSVGSRTDKEDSILVIGHDWDSTVAYYSGRRALTLPTWAPKEVYDDAISRAENFGAIVICDEPNREVAGWLNIFRQKGINEVDRVERCAIYQ